MRHVLKVLALVLVTSFILIGPATAVQDVTTHTKLRLSSKTIQLGDRVKFKAHLKADVAACYQKMPIKLYKNGHKVAKKKTDKQGKAVFKRHPKATAQWRVKFPGKQTGTHPDRLNCLPSKSKKKTVTVTP